MSKKSVYFLAGEPSGDAHAAEVLRELRTLVPGLSARGVGGPALQRAGMELRADLATDAVMGLFPVIAALPRLWRIFSDTVTDLRRDPPSALVLVDYPGFNLRMAKKAKDLGIPVIYYISPQVWAWRRGRIAKMRRTVDLMLTILPFEADLYADSGLRSVYVGHPILDATERRPPEEDEVRRLRALGSPLIGIFPGSRQHVVESLLPDFLRALDLLRAHEGLSGARGVVAFASEEHARLLPPDLAARHGVLASVAKPTAVMAAMDAAFSTSGTTTLEITAHRKPFAIGYRVSPLTYGLGRLLISVPHIGLVNLVAGRGVVPEHVGVRSIAGPMAESLARLLSDEEARARQVQGLEEVMATLAKPGSYRRAAEEISAFLDGKAAPGTDR